MPGWQVAWSYDAHDAFKDSEMQSNPIVVDRMLYVTTPKMRVVALDAMRPMGANSGASIRPRTGDRPRRFRHRGVTVYKDRVFVSYRNFLYALDRKTGKPIGSFGDNGRIDLRNGLDRPAENLTVSASSPGVIFEDMIIMGSTVPETLPGSPGHIRAFDANSGKQRWIFHTIPHPGEPGYETWPPEAYKISGGANAWAGLTVDPKLAMVFAATGSASFDFYGANRIGDNLFADCVLALDARTGKRIWHFQAIKHDVWDLDFPAPPSLVTVTRNGKKVDAVAQIAKTGYVFVFDRKTGEPLFPIAQRKAPQSLLDGEKLSETQPLSREAAALHPAEIRREHGHEPHAGGARGRARHVAEDRFEWYFHSSQHSRHDADAGNGWRRRMGRRGIRSRYRAALCQLQ